MAVKPLLFSDVTSALTQFIAEKDAREGNIPTNAVANANSLIIAIENAENTFKDRVAAEQNAKAEQFRKWSLDLKTTGYGQLDLPDLFRHSIDEGTSDGWIPKVYSVNPKHIAPDAAIILEIFGKFKYWDKPKYMPKLTVGTQTFDPIATSHAKLTFKLTFTEKEWPFKDDKCTQFFAKLVVPYEAGHVMSNIKTFEFNLPIRTLPRFAGTLTINSQNPKKMTWDGQCPVEIEKNSLLTFESFDGIKQRISGAELVAAKKELPPFLHTHFGTYLRISQLADYEELRNRWMITLIPPGKP
jgi:hypothetical protein